MAHAKARGREMWQKGAPLWSTLLIFSAMHSRAEDFSFAAMQEQGARERHTWGASSDSYRGRFGPEAAARRTRE